MIRIFPICVLLICAISNAALVQWSASSGGNGHFYEVVSVPEAITWTGAKVAAEQRGGYLATVTSQAESDFVFTLINVTKHFASYQNYLYCWGPWLGGYQNLGAATPDADWHWITGEAWDYTNWDCYTSPYSTTQHPDDLGKTEQGRENYLSYGCGYAGDWSKWNDIGHNGAKMGAVIVPITAYVFEIPEPCATLFLAVGGLLVCRRKGSLNRN